MSSGKPRDGLSGNRNFVGYFLHLSLFWIGWTARRFELHLIHRTFPRLSSLNLWTNLPVLKPSKWPHALSTKGEENPQIKRINTD